MTTIEVAIRAGTLIVASLFLSGCDKLKEFEGLKVDAANSTMQIAELKAELNTVRERLVALEVTKKKVPSNDGPQPLSEEQIVMLKKVITQCVQVVRNSAPKDDLSERFYAQFDAFYNPASGRVQNNNIYNGGLPAVYAFNKCMTSQGFPLQ